MLWQFGELGFDKSINLCENGTISNDCRLSPKPVLWSYQDDVERMSLFSHTADMLRLRNTYPVFTMGTATLPSSTLLVKQATIKSNPYTETPATENEMNVQVVINFELASRVVNVTFPHTGTWYDYYAYGETVNVTSASHSVTLKPGEYKLYTDYPIENLITGIEDITDYSQKIVVFPNPTIDSFSIQMQDQIQSVQLLSMNGQKVIPPRINSTSWSVEGIASGLYIVQIQTSRKIIRTKLIKE
jgi:hypothetical protein